MYEIYRDESLGCLVRRFIIDLDVLILLYVQTYGIGRESGTVDQTSSGRKLALATLV
jgi:hypothetical protein